MKIFKFCLSTVAVLTLLYSTQVMAAYATAYPQSRIDTAGNIVSVWLAYDTNGNPIIQGCNIVNSVASTPYNISYDISDNIASNQPALYSNATSNPTYIATWQYYDYTSGNYFIAASIYDLISDAWNTSVVSLTTESANYGDQKLSINNAGDVYLTWTSTIDNNSVIRASTYTIGTSTAWSTPITVSQ